MLDPRKTHEKKFWTHEIPTEKFLGPQNTHEEKFRIHKTFMKKNIGPTMTQWYETHETHNGTRPTELSTLLLFTNHLLANGCVNFDSIFYELCSCKIKDFSRIFV